MRIELFSEIVSSSRSKYICPEGIAGSSFLDSTKFKEIRLLGVKREALAVFVLSYGLALFESAQWIR